MMPSATLACCPIAAHPSAAALLSLKIKTQRREERIDPPLLAYHPQPACPYESAQKQNSRHRDSAPIRPPRLWQDVRNMRLTDYSPTARISGKNLLK